MAARREKGVMDCSQMERRATYVWQELCFTGNEGAREMMMKERSWGQQGERLGSIAWTADGR